MERITGHSVCEGVAIGTLRFFKRRRREVTKMKVKDAKSESKRLEKAREKAIAELARLHEKTLNDIGEKEAALFEIHQMMLEDEDYRDSINAIIEGEGLNAEHAVATTREEFARMFSEMDDPYMQARSADVRDVSDRLLDCLSGECGPAIDDSEPIILAAKDLTPSETVQLDKSKILAFVTAEGSGNSHTAILARTMGLPAVIRAGDGLREEWDGRLAVVDGFTGDVYIDPDGPTLDAMRHKQEEHRRRLALLDQYRGKPNVTLDGRSVDVFANIGSVAELDSVLRNDAGGIGLFRSEFLYLEGDDYPDEERQFAAYRSVAKAMSGKKAVIRTLDIGADKRIGYFELPEEENPALGIRGVRLCLERPQVFKTQLRALYRASAFGPLAIMFPMIASVWEVREARGIIEEVKTELRAEKRDFNPDMEVGVMIETPAAALISDRLAPEVDFFSIGTNDLTQYTLAVDRQSRGIDRYCDPHHEAVQRLIGMVVENAHRQGIWVGVCGELAGDPAMTETLLRLGVDELSVSPPKVLELRKRITETRISR